MKHPPFNFCFVCPNRERELKFKQELYTCCGCSGHETCGDSINDAYNTKVLEGFRKEREVKKYQENIGNEERP